MKNLHSYSWLVLDIDGTTVTSDKVLDPKTRDVLVALQTQGIRIVLASGRPLEGIYPIAKQLGFDSFDGYMVAFNGSIVQHYRTGKRLFETYLSHSLLLDIWNDAYQYGLGIMTYDTNRIISGTCPDAFMKNESKWSHLPIEWHENFIDHIPENVCQCVLTGSSSQLTQVQRSLESRYMGRASLYHSEPNCLEVTPYGVDKSYGMKRLFSGLHISPSQIVFCGDSYNDIGMLQYAQVGVAMANAPSEVKSVADYVTKHSNDEQGLLEVVQRFFLCQGASLKQAGLSPS